LPIFGDECPQNGSKNDKMAPRTTLRYPHEGPRVMDTWGIDSPAVGSSEHRTGVPRSQKTPFPRTQFDTSGIGVCLRGRRRCRQRHLCRAASTSRSPAHTKTHSLTHPLSHTHIHTHSFSITLSLAHSPGGGGKHHVNQHHHHLTKTELPLSPLLRIIDVAITWGWNHFNFTTIQA